MLKIIVLVFLAKAVMDSLGENETTRNSTGLTEKDFINLNLVNECAADQNWNSSDAKNETGSHYYLSINRADWHAATEDCKAFLGENATLLFIETFQEFILVERLIIDSGRTVRTFWIGGEYQQDRALFQWANGHAIGDWALWDKGYPDSHLSVTKVAGYINGGALKLRTQLQTVPNRYLCEQNNTMGTKNNKTNADMCLAPNDLVFVLDASGSVSTKEFGILLDFTFKLTTAWLKTRETRVSIITFSSSSVNTLFTLDESRTLKEKEIEKRIQNAPHPQGYSFMHLGLERALKELETQRRNSSQPFPRNALVLTDSASSFPVKTHRAAGKLLDEGVRTCTVGVGHNFNGPELLVVSGNRSDRVFTVDSFDRLKGLLPTVSREICSSASSGSTRLKVDPSILIISLLLTLYNIFMMY